MKTKRQGAAKASNLYGPGMSWGGGGGGAGVSRGPKGYGG